MDLPLNPSQDQIAVLQKYLDQQKKELAKKTPYGARNYYEDKTNVVGKKVVIFKHSQKKNDYWYMRMYVGNRKYKQVSLNVKDKDTAIEKSLEEWRKIQNQIDGGGDVFQVSLDQLQDRYDQHLQQLVDTGQMKKTTINGKRTSLKKLRLILEDYSKPTDIPSSFLNEYTTWRRTKNWNKDFHKRRSTPPSELTINKELTDFKGFFDYLNSDNIQTAAFLYPFHKVNYRLSDEKNPSFDEEDWTNLVFFLRTWVRMTDTPKGNARKWNFYRFVLSEYMKILANSGMRPHEALLLRWNDIELKKKVVENNETGKKSEYWGVIIQVSPLTKTGRREVICPAGIYFKRLHKHYCDAGFKPHPSDFIFRNIGTKHSKGDKHFGNALTSGFLRRLWYELEEDFESSQKGYSFTKKYTVYSCRSFFINQRLELGIPPSVVGELVGHTLATMEKFYKKLQIRNMEPELMKVKRRRLEESEFLTWDLDQPTLPSSSKT